MCFFRSLLQIVDNHIDNCGLLKIMRISPQGFALHVPDQIASFEHAIAVSSSRRQAAILKAKIKKNNQHAQQFFCCSFVARVTRRSESSFDLDDVNGRDDRLASVKRDANSVTAVGQEVSARNSSFDQLFLQIRLRPRNPHRSTSRLRDWLPGQEKSRPCCSAPTGIVIWAW